MPVHLRAVLAAMVWQQRAMRRWGLLGLVLLPVGACQTLSPDGGMDAVADIAGHALNKDIGALRTPEVEQSARARVEALLRKPLTANTAVQIALLNNRGLQAAYDGLGVAEAVMVQASLPPSPTIALSGVSTPVELDIERRLVADILSLATLPAREEIAMHRYRQAQLRAAKETLRLAGETRRAYYVAVGSRQLAGFLAEGVAAAETTAQLTKRLNESGAVNKLDQTRDQVFYAETTAQLATARDRAGAAQERLARAMGIDGSNPKLQLPNALPLLPRRPHSLSGIETEAVQKRVDLQIARIEVEALAKSYGLTNATRYVNLLDVSAISRTQREPTISGTGGGAELELQVPIFDFGETRLRQAGETYMQAVNRLTEKAINVRSEARDAYRHYRSTYDVASRYRDEVLPLRKSISDEMMLRYGAMQVDVFSLLTEARQRIDANIAAIEAQRDFWLADADLREAIIGGGMAPSEGAGESGADDPPGSSSGD